jgi:hypothetical protein
MKIMHLINCEIFAALAAIRRPPALLGSIGKNKIWHEFPVCEPNATV